MQIEFYNNFIRFLARLAELVISLLRTLKNNLSDLVVTFARSAFQRNSAMIEVFLVSVVVALGGTWQDLDLLGHELAESVVKFALLPFFVKIKGRLSSKAKRDKGVNKVINEMNRLSESMEGQSTENANRIFKQILAKEKDLNKALHAIDEPGVRFQGDRAKPGQGEAVGYGKGLHPLGVYSESFEEAAKKLDLSGAADTTKKHSRFPNTILTNLEKAHKSGDAKNEYYKKYKNLAPFAPSLLRTKNAIQQTINNLSKDRGFYHYISKSGKKTPPRPYIRSSVKGNTQQKIKKLERMLDEISENPRAFYLKYGVPIKVEYGFRVDDLPDTPLPKPERDRLKPKTHTKIILEERAGQGRVPIAVRRDKDQEINFDDSKEIQAEKQKEFEKSKAALYAYKPFMKEGAYEEELKRITEKAKSADVLDILESAGIDLEKYPGISKSTSPVEAFRSLKDKYQNKFSAIINKDIYSNKYPYIRFPSEIRADGMLTEDTYLNNAKIIPNEDGSIPVNFTKSVLEDVDATDVTDWSKTEFGDVKSGSVAVLRGEGAKSFKKHHNDKIYLLSQETQDKYKEIFGDYLNRQ